MRALIIFAEPFRSLAQCGTSPQRSRRASGSPLGETIAIYLIISPIFSINLHILGRGANSIAAHIALRYGEANGFSLSALMAAGLALFVLTMIVNFTASAVIARSRSGAESEG